MLDSITPTRIKHLRFGHTPDPDDAFMFYGFAIGQVKVGEFEVHHALEDIESLNQKAVKGELEITAISAAMYPFVSEKYWILSMGASVGRNYGPIVACLEGPEPKRKRIGVPGLNTTALLLLKLYTEGFEPVVYRFDEIPHALQRKEIEYGLLIHEAQITYQQLGLKKILDLGEMWMNDTHLPIPLGLDVVRKDLGKELAVEIARAFKKSIDLAMTHRPEAVIYAQKYGRGLKMELTDQFVGMYVNQDTLDLGEEGEKALALLFQKGTQAGIYKSPTPVEVVRP